MAALATGCASKGEKSDRPDNPFRPNSEVGLAGSSPQTEKALKLEAADAYKRAHDAMLASDYETATTRYTQLIARYPFTEYSTQAELEKIFVQYRSFQPDEALLAADRFIREHPRHAHADYVQYLKGLINSSRTQSISDFLPIDSTKKDVTGERRAYDDFAVLLQRYPTSPYAGDARKRMIYLRNRVAAHELSVVRYYVKRQAWVAVAKRAENLIAEYPGAPATADALLLLKLSYEKLDLKPQLADVDRLIVSNAASLEQAKAPKPKPGPRTVIELPVATTAAVAAPAAAAAVEETATPAAANPSEEAPKGLFGRIAGYFEALNKSYTLDGKDAPVATDGKPAAATTGGAPSNQPGAASLSSGPYVGEPTVINIAPVTGDGAAAAEAPAATATAEPAAKKKEKAGFFDFLNKSYTIGGDKKPTEPATASDAPPPAAGESQPEAPAADAPKTGTTPAAN